jgi:hypothetical protein
MVNYVRKISKGAKGFDDLPEFIRNLANMVFAMNDKNCKNFEKLNFYVTSRVSIFPNFSYLLTAN